MAEDTEKGGLAGPADSFAPALDNFPIKGKMNMNRVLPQYKTGVCYKSILIDYEEG
ncbi:hypothetical protein EVA_11871, partial [gut metagenome]